CRAAERDRPQRLPAARVRAAAVHEDLGAGQRDRHDGHVPGPVRVGAHHGLRHLRRLHRGVHPSITDTIARFPDAPGVYLILGAKGKALYVGKAARLRDRARSYLKAGGDGRPQLRFLEDEAVDVEFLVTATEQEALLLENTVIKKRKPTYNVKLKDDKAFLLLRLDRREDWPWFRLVRRRQDDGASYFGPYASATSV